MSNMLSGGLPGPHNPTYVNCSATNPSWENKRSSWKGRSQIREMQPRHQPQAFASGCEVAAERSTSLNAHLGNLLPTKAEANPAYIHLPARRRTEAASSRWCSWEGGRKRRGRRHQAPLGPSTRGQSRTEHEHEPGCRADSNKQRAGSACAAPDFIHLHAFRRGAAQRN